MCWPVLTCFKLIFRTLREFLTGALALVAAAVDCVLLWMAFFVGEYVQYAGVHRVDL
jgi:hypothetical protein